MGESGDFSGSSEAAETSEVSETAETTETSEVEDEISSEYDNYLEEDKAQEYEHESAEEKEGKEVSEVKGGSYRDIKENMKERNETGEEYEVHHTPADSCTELSRNEGPAIKMERDDHRQTASCGYSREAQEYRAQQKELIDNGKFDEAVQMDVDDIKEKFGDKYDEGIDEMRTYSQKFK